ncbi:transglycosylase SLT domain-containing protein [Acinetobacter haemolyticus]|uniref:lytic transglycosylase domain-containing protein n=1 Tax=unclassified Acinetobacter TaxID=196816 RepID=UPI00211EBBD2|nr:MULTISPECIES: transglycosylase SLT domain-containing protein [unclassified Acinetobacter]UDM39600.1 transglycosylase SLT domain-containing protein [Acinetobacter haemolyticus]
MFFTQHFSYLSSKKSNYHLFTFKSVAMIVTTLTFFGCTSLNSNSIAKRSEKLSTGIQKAYSVESATANRVSPMIIQSADKYNVDPILLAAMIQQESSYRNSVISPAGAVGLTQVIPSYWQQTCPGDLYNESSNIQCGTYILSKYNQSSGNWKKALAYYNVGPSGYENNRKMRKQGKRYTKQVKQHQKNLKNAL